MQLRCVWLYIYIYWLVVYLHLWKNMKVSWDDSPQYMEKWNMFRTTNQHTFIYIYITCVCVLIISKIRSELDLNCCPLRCRHRLSHNCHNCCAFADDHPATRFDKSWSIQDWHQLACNQTWLAGKSTIYRWFIHFVQLKPPFLDVPLPKGHSLLI